MSRMYRLRSESKPHYNFAHYYSHKWAVRGAIDVMFVAADGNVREQPWKHP